MLVYLFLIVIILFTIDGFKLTAIYGNRCFTRQPGFAKELYIQFKHALQRHGMGLAKIGNGMVIGLQLLQQSLQSGITAALLFQLAAAAYFI